MTLSLSSKKIQVSYKHLVCSKGITLAAEALWWQNHGRPDKADEVLESYC